MRFFVINKFFLIGLMFSLGVYAQGIIEEEILPQTATLRQIANKLDTLIDEAQSLDPTAGLAQLDSLRNDLAFLSISSTGSQKKQVEELTLRSYLLEMTFHFYNEDLKQAKSSALKVFKLNPSAILSGQIATAELAMWFEEIRESTVGFISIFSQPPGGEITIDGEYFGITPMENVFAPLGEHEIRVTRDGYTTWIGQIDVRKDVTEIVRAEQRRQSGSILMWVSPPGTQISVDSETVIQKVKPLHHSLYPMAMIMGFAPEKMGQPVVLEPLKPGTHLIELKKECQKSESFELDLRIGQFMLPPLILQKARGFLTVTTSEPGQKIYIDGAFQGETPLQHFEVCPGHHLVEVRFGDGKEWTQEISLADKEAITLTAEARPVILFLGCASSDTALAIEGTYPIRKWFEESKYFNITPFNRSQEYRFRPEVASVFEYAAQHPVSSMDLNWKNLLDNLTASLLDSPATIFAFARLEPTSGTETGQLVFLHELSSHPDIIPIPQGMPPMTVPDSLDRILKESVSFQRLRCGIRYTTMDEQVIISEIISNSPAEVSPFQAGDIISSINGIPVTNRIETESVLCDPSTPENVSFEIQRSVKTILSTINAVRQPVIMPLKDPGIPYNLILGRIESEIIVQGNVPELLINAGVCAMAIHRGDIALEYFSDCELDSHTPGINKGTLNYLVMLAQAVQGTNPPSINHQFRDLQILESTIIHGDGPYLQDLLQ